MIYYTNVFKYIVVNYPTKKFRLFYWSSSVPLLVDLVHGHRTCPLDEGCPLNSIPLKPGETLSNTKKYRLTGFTAFGLRGGYSEKNKQLFLSLSKFNINFEVIARLWSQRVLRRLNANPSWFAIEFGLSVFSRERSFFPIASRSLIHAP